MAAYSVEKLVVTDFRNYRRAELALSPESVVLTGDNGAGKTNLLEALSYLAPGRGLRGVKLGEVTRIGARSWGVAAVLRGPNGRTEIGTGIEAKAPGDSGADRRIVQVDGVQHSGSALLAQEVQLSWLTPQMDRLFVEGPGGRRRFLDRLVLGLHPAHGRAVAAYERAMRERNRLLGDGQMDDSWLSALELQMAEHGVAVAAARLDTVARLQAAVETTVSAFPLADLAVSGVLEDDLAVMPAVEAEDRFRARLRANRQRDAALGRSSEGPQASDLCARHRAKGMAAEHCSTGEQKALLIGIVLAAARLTQAEVGAAPVLLLDEVAAHLDARRRAALFEEILALGAQAFLTGTDLALFEDLLGRAQFYNINAGAITRLPAGT